MGKARRTAPLVAAVLGLAFLPASAGAGYDIAHIVERTCEPGGPLIVADEWKQPKARDRVLTEPGEVIACPSVGAKTRYQIAARSHRCAYFSLFNGDGADICLIRTNLAGGAGAVVEPLIAIAAGRSERLAVAGIVSEEVATVAVTPTGRRSPEATVIPVAPDQAERLGAPAAFGYFSVAVDRGTLCADRHARVLGRDSSGGRVAASEVPASTRALSAADDVAYAHSLRRLCESAASGGPASSGWWAKVSAVLRTFLGAWL